MSVNKQITSDDLAKIAATLNLIGDGLALLALEKAARKRKKVRIIRK